MLPYTTQSQMEKISTEVTNDALSGYTPPSPTGFSLTLTDIGGGALDGVLIKYADGNVESVEEFGTYENVSHFLPSNQNCSFESGKCYLLTIRVPHAFGAEPGYQLLSNCTFYFSSPK